ncbi:hypothetical protein BC831DRAFT_473016 [Entophlyctis helioformis]|nr:hypothetical protein BC831DRAFT_473016 [Entophlyctis helioformis]
MSMVANFIKRHFGGLPRSVKELQWIYRVNPDSEGSAPQAKEYRVPAPGSQPETYVGPKNPQISNIQYFKRDTRRAFPQTVVFSQSDLQKALPTPSVQSIAAGEGAVNAGIKSEFMPPIINNRYQYKPSAPHLKADASNPEFCIRGLS